MVGQGSRQSTPNWIELLPEALVVTAQVAQESWSLLLPMLAAFRMVVEKRRANILTLSGSCLIAYLNCARMRRHS